MRKLLIICAAVFILAACGSPEVAAEPARTPAASAGVNEADLGVARTMIDALNRGDSTAARALFAPTARFDSVGRIYPDREAIFGRFLDPEVIAVGGRYTELSARADGDRIVVEYDFTTRSGSSERFTYAYRVQDGVITDVIGRYV